DPGSIAGATLHDVGAPNAEGRLGAAYELSAFARRAAVMLAAHRPQLDIVHARAPSLGEADVLHLPGVVAGELRRERESQGPVSSARRALDLALPVTRPLQTVRRRLERDAIESSRVREIHVDSRWVRDDLLALYDVDPAAVLVVSPGVDLDEFQPAADRAAVRRELGLPEDGPLLLFCGSDFRRKGLDRAIEALARMRQRARLVVVGGGQPAPFRRLAREAGVGDRLHFAGRRSDVSRFYQAADALVLPTRLDLWGVPILEAMAAAIPAVTTSAAGAAEAVVDGE